MKEIICEATEEEIQRKKKFREAFGYQKMLVIGISEKDNGPEMEVLTDTEDGVSGGDMMNFVQALLLNIVSGVDDELKPVIGVYVHDLVDSIMGVQSEGLN